MRGQLGEAELLRCRRKPRLTGVGGRELPAGSSPPGATLRRQPQGGRRPALPARAATQRGRPCARAQPPSTGADPAPPPAPGGLAASPSSPRGSSDRAATAGRPPQRPGTRRAGKRRGKGRKETGAGAARSPRQTGGSSRPRREKPPPSRYLSGRAPLAAQPGSSQLPPWFKPASPRRACAPRRAPALLALRLRGAERLRRPRACSEMGCARHSSGPFRPREGLAQPNAAGNSVTE